MNQDDPQDFRDDLIRQLREGRVVAIVGAGVSTGATNRAPCASWTGLLHDGVKRCVKVANPLPKRWAERVGEEIDSKDLLEMLSAAEKVTERLGGRGSAEYRRWLEESVGGLQAAEPSVIQALQELGVALATTNYDSLLEQVTGLEPVTWQDEADAVAAVRGEKPGVLHLHGHWKKPESVVLGIRSYEAVLGSDLAQTILRVLQTARTVLFVGCGEGLNDPNFGTLLEWTGQVLGQATHRHFRLCLDGELADLKKLHPPEKRLFPIAYGPNHAALLPFLKSLLASVGTALQPATGAARAPARPTLNLAAYAKAVRDRYARLKLESMDATGSYYRELELWRVFIPQNVRECQEYLPQVLELPKEQLRRLRESDQWDGGEVDADELAERRRSYLDQSLRNVLELVDDPGQSHLVLLGDPGSGKSSLLQTLAVQWADTSETPRAALDLPLLVELRTYAQAHERDQTADFLHFIEHGHGIPCRLDGGALKKGLETGRVRVFFDGLDEVFDPALREQVVNAIQLFASDFPRARIIVTSRVIGYMGESFRSAGFRHFMLQELDDEQIAAFLNKWHDDTYRPAAAAERDEKHGRLARAIEESPAIRELVGNPLLLTMAAILNGNRDLPRQRVELFEKCAELLLQQWKAEEALRADRNLEQDALAIGLREKQTILRRLAREMRSGTDGALGNLIGVARLEAVIEEVVRPLVKGNPVAVARALIRHLRERNFILCFAGGDSYAFVHRTFLEYFCANDFRVRFDYEKTIDAEFLKQEVYGRHWADEGWHEVLCLLAGMIHADTVREILVYLLAQPDTELTCYPVVLAARCVGEARNVGDVGAVGEEVRERLQSLTSFDLPYNICEGDEIDQGVGKIRVGAVALASAAWGTLSVICSWLKVLSQSDEDWRVRQAAMEALARGWKDDPDTLPILKALAQSDEKPYVRRAAVEALAQWWRGDPEILAWLKARLRLADSKLPPQAAMEALARGWKDEPDVLSILKARAQSDEDKDMRQVAVEALARGWKGNPEIVAWLKALAQSNEEWRVRETAVQQLARNWKNDADTLSILRALAQSDQDNIVRLTAMQELARGWKDDAETLAILKARAQLDEDDNVRQTAIQELARGWKDDSEILPMIKARAQTDEAASVRQTAVQELARGWEADPETLPILKARAQTDEAASVRSAAVEALAGNWKADPETFPILKARAESDQEAQVRYTAVETLARCWTEHPEILSWLKTRAQLDDAGNVRIAAVEAVVEVGKNDQEALSWVKAIAQSDGDSIVRAGAVRALARGWKDHPNALSWLKVLARNDPDRWVRKGAVEAVVRSWHKERETAPWLIELASEDEERWVRVAAILALMKGWKDAPEVQEFLRDLQAASAPNPQSGDKP